jgi:hypothetical protein
MAENQSLSISLTPALLCPQIQGLPLPPQEAQPASATSQAQGCVGSRVTVQAAVHSAASKAVNSPAAQFPIWRAARFLLIFSN